MVDRPMKGTGQDKIIICGELAQASLKLALIDQATGLIDDDERKDGPKE